MKTEEPLSEILYGALLSLLSIALFVTGFAILAAGFLLWNPILIMVGLTFIFLNWYQGEIRMKKKRPIMETTRLPEQMETLKSVATAINELEEEFMELESRRADLQQKISALLKEKEEIVKTIGELKERIEFKKLAIEANALEAELKELREEERRLRTELESFPQPTP